MINKEDGSPPVAGAVRREQETERTGEALLQAVSQRLSCAFAVARPDGSFLARSAGARDLLHDADRIDPHGPAGEALRAAHAGRTVHGARLPAGDGTVEADLLPLDGLVLVRLGACATGPHRLFHHSRDLLAVSDHDGVLLHVNPSWTDRLGWREDELVGRHFLDLVHPADHESTQREAERLARHQEVVHFENRYRCRDGGYRWLQWNAVSPPGGPVYAVARDVTDQRNAVTRLHAAYEALQDAEQHRLRLFQHVVHDLASPLSAMGVQLALLESQGRSEDVVRLRQVHDHLRRLVDDVRDLSLAEGRQLRLRREPTPARDLLGPTLDALRPTAEARGIRLRARVEDVVLDVDPLRFNQIVYNLVTNALKFTPTDGRVEVVAARRQDTALLTVEDTGHGLDPDEARRVFQPFVQVHDRVTERGSGLGLFICKQLVEAHGGRVWVESAGRGTGSRFVVELPVA